MGLATRMGMMGALVGGMTAELRRWETERAEAAELRKQQRLEEIQMAREARQEESTIRSEGRLEDRTIRSEGRQEDSTIRAEDRGQKTWEKRTEIQDGVTRGQATHSAGLSYGNSAALQEDSQAHATIENDKQRKSTEAAAALRGGNDTDKPIRLMIESQAGEQKLVVLNPGEAIPAGWRAITTNNASSPMPSASKEGARTRAAAAAKPWTPPQGVTVKQVR